LKEFNPIVVEIIKNKSSEEMKIVDDFKLDYLSIDKILKALMYFSSDDCY